MGQLARVRVSATAGPLAPTTGRSRWSASLPVSGLVLAGIFGMHGLAKHGMDASVTSATQMSQQMSGTVGELAVAVPSTTHVLTTHVRAVRAVLDVAGVPAAGGAGMAGSCLAVLGGLLLLLLCLVMDRRRTASRVDRSVRQALPATLGAGVSHSLVELSVWRC